MPLIKEYRSDAYKKNMKNSQRLQIFMQMGRKRGGRGKFDFVSFQSTMAQLPYSGSMFEGLLSGFVDLQDTFRGKRI